MPTFDTAPIVSLGDKVVSDINGTTWTPTGGADLSFTARRVYYLVEYEPTDAGLHVDLLIAQDDSEEPADRGGVADRTFVVAIGIQKNLTDKTSASEVDALVNFANALMLFYGLEVEFTVTGSQKARCVKREMPVIYSPEEIDKNGRFFAVVHLTLEGWYAQP